MVSTNVQNVNRIFKSATKCICNAKLKLLSLKTMQMHFKCELTHRRYGRKGF